jgi:hypothetical protein
MKVQGDMADKKCPKCGLWSSETALRCDCGYDFVTGQQKTSFLTGNTPLAIEQIKKKGKWFMIIGAAIFAFSVLFSITTYLAAVAKGGGTYLVWTGGLILGLGMFLQGLTTYRKPNR